MRKLIINFKEAHEALLAEIQKFEILRGMKAEKQRINGTILSMQKYSFEKTLDNLMDMWKNIPYKSLKMSAATACKYVLDSNRINV